jgi:hypothetical protein
LTTSRDESLYLKLVESLNYRDFLKLWLSEGGRNGTKISFGDAAKRCGFKSRAYLSDLIHERRSLSQNALEQIQGGLSSLPNVVSKYFEYLVFSEESELRPDGLNKDKIASKLKILRQRSKRMYSPESKSLSFDSVETLITNPNFHLCYAALGLDQSGESIAKIASKTGLEVTTIRSLLAEMCKKGFAAKLPAKIGKEELYTACDAHRVIEGLAPNKAFHTFMINWLSFLLQKVKATPPNRPDLYNLSTFRVKSSDKEPLRSKIVNAIDSLVEEFETDKGDSLVSLSVFYLSQHRDK